MLPVAVRRALIALVVVVTVAGCAPRTVPPPTTCTAHPNGQVTCP